MAKSPAKNPAKKATKKPAAKVVPKTATKTKTAAKKAAAKKPAAKATKAPTKAASKAPAAKKAAAKSDVKLTTNELAALKAIAEAGAKAAGSEQEGWWSLDVLDYATDCPLSPKQFASACGSLAKKGLTISQDHGPINNRKASWHISITDAGMAALTANRGGKEPAPSKSKPKTAQQSTQAGIPETAPVIDATAPVPAKAGGNAAKAKKGAAPVHYGNRGISPLHPSMSERFSLDGAIQESIDNPDSWLPESVLNGKLSNVIRKPAVAKALEDFEPADKKAFIANRLDQTIRMILTDKVSWTSDSARMAGLMRAVLPHAAESAYRKRNEDPKFNRETQDRLVHTHLLHLNEAVRSREPEKVKSAIDDVEKDTKLSSASLRSIGYAVETYHHSANDLTRSIIVRSDADAVAILRSRLLKPMEDELAEKAKHEVKHEIKTKAEDVTPSVMTLPKKEEPKDTRPPVGGAASHLEPAKALAEALNKVASVEEAKKAIQHAMVGDASFQISILRTAVFQVGANIAQAMGFNKARAEQYLLAFVEKRLLKLAQAKAFMAGKPIPKGPEVKYEKMTVETIAKPAKEKIPRKPPVKRAAKKAAKKPAKAPAKKAAKKGK